MPWASLSNYFGMLDCYVAVGAVDDAASRKIPRVVGHALDFGDGFASHSHTHQVGAVVERPTPDARHAVRYCHTREGCASESTPTDARHAVANRHTRQVGTILEHTHPDAQHAAWYRHAGNPAAAVERIIPDACHTVRYRHARKPGAGLERP